MIRIFTDGACSPNPGHMGIGVVIEWQGIQPEIISEYAGEGTNNIAEYRALIKALKLINKYEIKVTSINSDSTLMVNQVNGSWKCKDLDLIKLRDRAQDIIKALKSRGYLISLNYIPREFNLADIPAKNGSNKR